MSNHKNYRRNTEEYQKELQELESSESSNLEKASKNVREQKKKVFGTQAQPAKGSAMREKTMSHLQDFVKRRYGLDLQPSGGKISEETGERRDENPDIGIDKPDWRSGEFEAQWSPDAAVHEAAHLELMPEGVDLPGGQRLMDQQYADIQRHHGYMKQKQSSFEKEPMALENPIRRRAGLPPTKRDVPVKEGAPARMTVDTGEPAAVRVQRGKKLVDQMAHAKLLRPESRQRQQDIDEGVIQYTPSEGWQPSSDPNALVNLRGQGRMEEAKSRLQQKYKPSASKQSGVDLSNLSPEDHAAVQDFLKQRKTKLAASEMEKSDPMGIRSSMKKSDDQYIHLSQDHRMTVNGKPNRFIKEMPKHVSDLKEIHSYFGRPMHTVSSNPRPSLGNESYKVHPDGSLTHIASKHDTGG